MYTPPNLMQTTNFAPSWGIYLSVNYLIQSFNYSKTDFTKRRSSTARSSPTRSGISGWRHGSEEMLFVPSFSPSCSRVHASERQANADQSPHHVVMFQKIVMVENHHLVGGLEHFMFFHILGSSSSQLTFICFRGVAQPPTSHPCLAAFHRSSIDLTRTIQQKITGI